MMLVALFLLIYKSSADVKQINPAKCNHISNQNQVHYASFLDFPDEILPQAWPEER
jgi:hypothetical protein